ncbi:hypothetical protein AgCh_002722 [Apium graveolens]
MSVSASILPVRNSTKPVANNHVPESISTHTRAAEVIHRSPRNRTIIDNAPTFVVKNTTTANPAASHNNAEAKPDPVNRRDYVVIEVRDFGYDMNDDSQPTRKSMLTNLEEFSADCLSRLFD